MIRLTIAVGEGTAARLREVAAQRGLNVDAIVGELLLVGLALTPDSRGDLTGPPDELTDDDAASSKPSRPRCGARTRQGWSCEAPAVWDHERDQPRNGRCRLHGGLSTGPRTPEGIERVRQAARASWIRRRNP